MAVQHIDFYVLNVGQGAFNYIEIVDDAGDVIQNILIDLGTHNSRDLSEENIEWLNERIEGRADPRINVVFLTHGDSDHYNLIQKLEPGLDPVADTRIGQVRYGGPQWRYKYRGQPNTIDFLEDYCTDVAKLPLDCSNYRSDTNTWTNYWIGGDADDDVYLRVILGNAPYNGGNLPDDEPKKKRGVNGEQVNTESLVSAIVWNDAWFVATGDATGKTLAAINDYLGEDAHDTIGSTVMMTLPHHGSRKTTYDLAKADGDIEDEWQDVVNDFINIFEPKSISISANEQYQHPSIDVINDFSEHLDDTAQYWQDPDTIGGNKHFLTAHIADSITDEDDGEEEWPTRATYYTVQTSANIYSTRYFDTIKFNWYFSDPPDPAAGKPAKKKAKIAKPTRYMRFEYPPYPAENVEPLGGAEIDDVAEFRNWRFRLVADGSVTLLPLPDTAGAAVAMALPSRRLTFQRQLAPTGATAVFGAARVVGTGGRLANPSATTPLPARAARPATGGFRNLRVIP